MKAGKTLVSPWLGGRERKQKSEFMQNHAQKYIHLKGLSFKPEQ